MRQVVKVTVFPERVIIPQVSSITRHIPLRMSPTKSRTRVRTKQRTGSYLRESLIVAEIPSFSLSGRSCHRLEHMLEID